MHNLKFLLDADMPKSSAKVIQDLGFEIEDVRDIYPGMEPINNLGEQAMREHVIMRKIIGCFRSEKGAKNYQYIASLLATWRLQGKNGFEELEGLLRQELCLS